MRALQGEVDINSFYRYGNGGGDLFVLLES